MVKEKLEKGGLWVLGSLGKKTGRSACEDRAPVAGNIDEVVKEK